MSFKDQLRDFWQLPEAQRRTVHDRILPPLPFVQISKQDLTYVLTFWPFDGQHESEVELETRHLEDLIEMITPHPSGHPLEITVLDAADDFVGKGIYWKADADDLHVLVEPCGWEGRDIEGLAHIVNEKWREMQQGGVA